MNSLLTAALAYAKRGWYVIPKKSKSKEFIAGLGPKHASVDPAQLKEWFGKHPNWNIAIVPGKSGLVGVDIDDEQAWKALGIEDKTPTFSTPTDGHSCRLYLAPELDSGMVPCALPDLEIKTKNSPVNAPPSVLLAGGYEWEREKGDPLPLSKAFLKPAKKTTLTKECLKVQKALKGERNTQLNESALKLGHLVPRELNRDDVEYALTEAALVAGLEPEEIAGTIQSGLEAGMKDPRDASQKDGEVQNVMADELLRVFQGINWVWAGWMPKGFLTLVAGAAGIGKSASVLQIALAFAGQHPWPNGRKASSKGKVYWIGTEGAVGLLAQRIINWEIDTSDFIIPPAHKDWTVAMDKEGEFEKWVANALEMGARLVVVDSLGGAHKGKEKEEEIGRFLMMIAKVAEKFDIVIIVILHVRKKGRDEGRGVTLDDLRGHSSIGAVGRVVWGLWPPNENSKRVRMEVIKSNVGGIPKALGLRFKSKPVTNSDGEVVDELTGIEFVEPPKKRRVLAPAVQEAVDFLKIQLSDGSKLIGALIMLGEANGIKRTSLQRGADALELKKVSRKNEARMKRWALPGSVARVKKGVK